MRNKAFTPHRKCKTMFLPYDVCRNDYRKFTKFATSDVRNCMYMCLRSTVDHVPGIGYLSLKDGLRIPRMGCCHKYPRLLDTLTLIYVGYYLKVKLSNYLLFSKVFWGEFH
jgi:hypothetical protein